jgi:Mg2+/Co2+ transporter CorB
LSTVLLTNTSVRVAGGSPILTPLFGARGFIVSIFAAEILPKQPALATRVKLAPMRALPLRHLQITTAPMRWVLAHVFVEPLTRILAGTHAPSSATRADELQQLVSICESEGLFDPR